MALFSRLTGRKAWRTFRDGDDKWSVEHKDRLRKDIPEINTFQTLTVTHGKILLLGPIKSGKSSFINSALSVQKDEMVQLAPEGGGVNSVTRKLSHFTCGNYLVGDTMGLEARDGVGFHLGDILYLLKGNVPEDYEFDQTKPINDKQPGFNRTPANADRVHCVIFCMSANEVQNEVQQGYLKKWQALQTEISSLLIPRILILTKIDQLSKDVQDDLSNTFKSKKIHEVVKKASELFCLPEMYIHPVKNFTNETYPKHEQGILLLLALKQALKFAEDFSTNLSRNTLSRSTSA